MRLSELIKKTGGVLAVRDRKDTYGVESILGWRRARLQTDADEEPLNEIERNNQRPRGARSNVLFGKEIPNASLLEITW